MRTFSQRRSQWQEHCPPEIRLRDLRIACDTLQVFLGGREVSLTVQEFDLLVLLARSPGKLQSKEELSRAMWNEVSANRKKHLSVVIARLRAKLGTLGSLEICNVRKRGYGLMLAPHKHLEESRHEG